MAQQGRPCQPSAGADDLERCLMASRGPSGMPEQYERVSFGRAYKCETRSDAWREANGGGHVSLLKYVRISEHGESAWQQRWGSTADDPKLKLQRRTRHYCSNRSGSRQRRGPEWASHPVWANVAPRATVESWKKQTWQSLVTWFTMVSSESSRTPRLRTTDVDVRAGEMSVSRWTSRLPSCCFVPNQMYWVLSPFKRRRFEAIHSETLSIALRMRSARAAESSGELKP